MGGLLSATAVACDGGCLPCLPPCATRLWLRRRPPWHLLLPPALLARTWARVLAWAVFSPGRTRLVACCSALGGVCLLYTSPSPRD
eukprot:9010266-Alexandrium_andersonii.AAC.1